MNERCIRIECKMSDLGFKGMVPVLPKLFELLFSQGSAKVLLPPMKSTDRCRPADDWTKNHQQCCDCEPEDDSTACVSVLVSVCQC